MVRRHACHDHPYLPVDALHTAGSATAAHEADGGVASLDLAWDVECLDLGGEVSSGLEGAVRLEDHDVASARHVTLVQTLDVHADVVAWASLLHTLVVHLHGEHLAGAGVGGSVGGQEDDLITGLDDALLDAASQHITDTLDLVGTCGTTANDTRAYMSSLDMTLPNPEAAPHSCNRWCSTGKKAELLTGDGQTEWHVSLALWDGSHVVEGVQESVHVDLAACCTNTRRTHTHTDVSHTGERETTVQGAAPKNCMPRMPAWQLR